MILRETSNERPQSAIIYDYSLICLSFEAWQLKQ